MVKRADEAMERFYEVKESFDWLEEIERLEKFLRKDKKFLAKEAVQLWKSMWTRWVLEIRTVTKRPKVPSTTDAELDATVQEAFRRIDNISNENWQHYCEVNELTPEAA